jgi:hypothetical protein
MKFAGGSVFACVATAVLALGSPTPARAQARPTPPQQSPGSETPQQMRDREANITLLERGKDEAISKDAAMKQMNEDFQRIQTEDADIMNAFSSANPPDYKKISDDAADIKVRAIRLKNFLVLPPSAKDEKRKKERESDNSELKSSVPALGESIKSFVSNPIFRQQAQQQVDYRDVAKARRDLDDVVDLSARIAKTAERLNKEPARSN